MKTNRYESQLWHVLAKQHLADLSQFYAPNFFDEVPFYSRNADVEFLKKLGTARANALLIGFSLKYLNALVAFDTPIAPFFAAITVRECGKRDLYVPHVFACHGDCDERLKGRIVLRSAGSSFGATLSRLVDAAKPGLYRLLEETVTVPGQVRAFIGHRVPMHAQSVIVHSLLDRSEANIAAISA